MSAADRAAAERTAQGLPPKITDPGTLARLAALLVAAEASGHVAPQQEGRRAA